jgi:protein tyrosine/serine phosphatase
MDSRTSCTACRNSGSPEFFFSTFANPDNYPIFYHCRGGADRTGSYAFILGALYGMNHEDLILEYELTSLSIWGTRIRSHALFSKFLEKFRALPGETYSEKARTFIRENAGLSDDEIDRICEIATEKQ